MRPVFLLTAMSPMLDYFTEAGCVSDGVKSLPTASKSRPDVPRADVSVKYVNETVLYLD